ncbi:hypothetical protein N8I77_006263 [Diaporthe amygdali]|uniref:Methyltransferase type 12 domain-containing protein n=1 Tax=Phomopsis amygdali TaxID=1214568 RepID=A0AAD9W6E8_PHOAM|nr:hypothetical protein N8I77_006263 [Diaporthe amygdali]
MDESNPVVYRTVGTRDKTVGWYDKDFPGIEPEARELLEKYSHVPPDEVDKYVIGMRDKAWEVHPYPCIGQYRFLSLSLRKKPSYPRVLEGLKAGARYLDIGCCVGQDIRKLVHDGAPSGNLYGAELEEGFVELGYDLFRDKDTLQTTLMKADVFNLGGDSPLGKLVGTVDYIHIGMVLHLFNWEKQRELLENLVKLLKAEPPGSMILGQTLGDLKGQLRPGGKMFVHDEDTFKKMWAEISERTGLKFECRPFLDAGLGISEARRKWDCSTTRRLAFEVERVG